jgi:hypothetical protein
VVETLLTTQTPDIDDGGTLQRGNHQIHPQHKNTCSAD